MLIGTAAKVKLEAGAPTSTAFGAMFSVSQTSHVGNVTTDAGEAAEWR